MVWIKSGQRQLIYLPYFKLRYFSYLVNKCFLLIACFKRENKKKNNAKDENNEIASPFKQKFQTFKQMFGKQSVGRSFLLLFEILITVISINLQSFVALSENLKIAEESKGKEGAAKGLVVRMIVGFVGMLSSIFWFFNRKLCLFKTPFI